MASFFRSFSNLVSDVYTIALARYFPGLFIVENPRLRAVRADDQLVLTFEFVNMTIHKASESDPEAYAIPGKDARLVVHFQSQNIAEKGLLRNRPQRNLPERQGRRHERGQTGGRPARSPAGPFAHGKAQPAGLQGAGGRRANPVGTGDAAAEMLGI